MRIEQADVLGQIGLGGGYRELRLRCRAIATDVRPGQFLHLRVPRLEQAVLRRPFSVFRAGAEELSVLYKTVGIGTEALAGICGGDRVSLMGPLGRGFPEEDPGSVPLLVAGGYGVAPLHFLASRMTRTGVVFIGGATSDDVLCERDFAGLGWDVRVATEDGSQGERGLVTAPLDKWLSDDLPQRGEVEFFGCGPDGMLRAVAERAGAGGRKAWLSLDKHMGCGVGACLACVQRIRRDDGGIQWGRVCRDGPVFEAKQIVWD